LYYWFCDGDKVVVEEVIGAACLSEFVYGL
jgi:hypothetical protein